MASGAKETFDHLTVSMNTGITTAAHRNSKSKIVQAPFGISAEVRKHAGQGSRSSYKNTNLTGSHNLESSSQPGNLGLSQNMSSANFAQGIGTIQSN